MIGDDEKRRMAEEILALRGLATAQPGGITAKELAATWDISDSTAARWLAAAVRMGKYTVTKEIRDSRYTNVYRRVVRNNDRNED